jgi:hypothetical protein
MTLSVRDQGVRGRNRSTAICHVLRPLVRILVPVFLAFIEQVPEGWSRWNQISMTDILTSAFLRLRGFYEGAEGCFWVLMCAS